MLAGDISLCKIFSDEVLSIGTILWISVELFLRSKGHKQIVSFLDYTGTTTTGTLPATTETIKSDKTPSSGKNINRYGSMQTANT